CHITTDANQTDRYYKNAGNGTFTNGAGAAQSEMLTHRGGAAADYDGDGDLDLFLLGPAAARRLYRNDLAATNRWVEVRCIGTTSNRAAIGARVEVNAVIAGAPRWQMREVSAQNSFNG